MENVKEVKGTLCEEWVDERELLHLLGACIEEIKNLKEAIAFVDGLGRLTDDVLLLLRDASFPMFSEGDLDYSTNEGGEPLVEDSNTVKKAKALLKKAVGFPKGYVPRCRKCEMELEVYPTDTGTFLRKRNDELYVKFDQGCPYCLSNSFDVIFKGDTSC